MKLHLPKGLRNAVMACMAALTSLSTTVGTGIIAGGAVTYMLATPQAHADFVWNGGTSGTFDSEDWKLQSNWNFGDTEWTGAGSGPGTKDSNMWAPIVLTGNGTANSLVFGEDATGKRIAFEGWNPKFNLNNGTTLYAQFTKFQGTDKWIKVDNNSTLDALLNGSGNEGGSLTVDVGANSNFTLRVAKNMGGDGLIINLNAATAYATILSDGNNRSVPSLTLSAVLTPSVGEFASQKLNFTLGEGVTLNNLTYAFADLVASDEQITAENASQHEGEFWVGDDYTVYYVHSSTPFEIAENTSIAWNKTGIRGYVVNKGVTLAIDNGSGGQGSATRGVEYGYGDIVVEKGGTLRFHAWGGPDSDVHDVTLGSNRPIITSDITLNDATVHFADGSYEFTGKVVVSGENTLQSDWSKSYFFHELSSEEDAVLNLKVVSHNWESSVEYAFVNAGDFKGEVKFDNGNADKDSFGLYLVLGHADALGNGTTVINTAEGGSHNIVSLNTGVVNLAGLTGNGKVELCERTGNAGLTAATVNLANAKGDFSGTLSSGITLNITGGTQGITGGTYDGFVKVAENGVLNVSGNVTLAHMVENAGKVDVSGVTGLVLGEAITGAAQTEGKVTTYTIISGGTVTGLETMSSDILKSAIVSDTLEKLGTEWSFANGILTITSVVDDLIWSGGDLKFADGSGDKFDADGVFNNEDNIAFQTADAQVTLESDVTITKLDVAADITVDINTGDYQMNVSSLNTEGEIVISGVGHSLGEVTGTGILGVAPGTAATLSEAIGESTTIGCPTVKITGEGTDLTIDNRLDDKVVIIDGATAQSGNAYFAKDVTLDNGAVLVASGQTELFNWQQNQKLSILNDSELQLGNVRMSLEGEDELVLNNSKITGEGDGDAAVDICKTAIKFSSQGISSISGPLRITASQTANINVIDGTLTVGEIKHNANNPGDSSLCKLGEGELKITSTISYTGVTEVAAGTLTLAMDSHVFAASKLVVAKGATLKLNTTEATSYTGSMIVDGSLVLNSALNITGALEVSGATSFSDGADGYIVADMILAQAGDSLTVGEGFSVSYTGEAVTDYTLVDNSVIANLADKSVYHVNSADYEYSATKIDATSTISIAENASLVIKTTGNTIAKIEMAEGGKVVIDNSEETSLNNIFGSAIDLTGTVVFKGSEVVNINGNDNGNLNNSDLIIDGGKVVVDIPIGHANMNGNITVTNSGVLTFKDNDTLVENTAQKITIDGGTWVSDGRTVLDVGDQVVLNDGTMSGTGDDYGAFDFDASLTVQVSGDSTISGPVRLRGGNTVSIELADGAELSFGNTNHVNNANNAGALKFTGNGVTTLTGTLGHTGGTTVEGGVLALAGTASFGSTTVTIAGGATLGLGTTALSMADATLALQNGSILSLAALSADTTPLTLKAVQQAGTVYIDTNAVEAVSAGTYNILAGTGMDVTKFALYGANAGKFVASYALTADNVLQMTLALNDKALVWTGDTADNVWNGTAENTPWEKLDGTVSAFAEKNVVNFTTDTPVEERTVTIADTVAPAAAYVFGTDWEWTGAGAINCSGALTVGDGSETELTIANTGAKTFTGGVTVNEDATLVVENADGWTGKVSGAGTLEVSVGTTLAQTGNSHWLVDRVGTDDGALNTIRLSGNTFIDQQSSSSDANKWLDAITTLEIEAGSCYAYNIGDSKNFTYSVVMKLAGSGGADNMGGALSLLSHSNWVGADKNGGQSTIINIDGIELMDDATIYVGAGKAMNKATVGAAVTSAGHTLTLTGGGQLALVRAFNDAFDFNIAQGTLLFDGSDLTGTGSATIADGATFHIKGRVDGAWKEIKLTDVTMVGGSLLNLENYRNQEIGTLTMDNGAKVRMENSLPSIDKLIVAAEDVATLQVDTTLGSCTTAIGTVEGAGTITLTRDGDGRGTIHRFDLVGENSFSGIWLLNKHISIRASHEDALANAVVELNWQKPDDASKKAKFELATETVKLKGLQGSIGTVDAGAVTSCELQFNTAGGDYSYGGNFDVSNKVNIVKNGAGSQSFTNTTNFAGNITVNEGTLNLSTAQSSAGREISIAGGAILGTALTLNGGTLSLDTTGATAASLGDNSLTLTVGTMLNLTVLGTEVTGTQITLLGGISEMKNVIVDENGSLGLLSDCFTMGVITDKSVSVDTPAVADAGAVDAWADRLGRSELFYDEEKGLLYLSLASNILDADPLYWDPADAAGNGSWLGNNWSEEDKLGVDPGMMQNPWQGDKPVSVVFDGDTAAKVTIDTDAVVTDLTVKNGGYTYEKDGETGTLTIEGQLKVEGTGTADISDMGAVEAGSLDVAGTLTADDLTVKGTAAVTGTVTADDELTITGAATVDGGTVGASSLGAGSLTASNGATVNATDIVIAGTAEITGSTVDAAGLLSAAGVVINGAAAKVEAAQLKVGEGGLSMSAGTLNAGSLFSNDGVTAEAVITGGTVTIGSSTLSSTTVTGAEFVGNSTLTGAADKAVTVGNITVDGAGKLTLSGATLNGKITVEDGGTLEIGGAMHLDTKASDFGMVNNSIYYAKADAEHGELIADGGNGFVSRNEVYTVVEGSLTNVVPQGSSWTVGEDKRVGSYDGGKVTVSEPMDTTAYWVNSDVTLSSVSGNFVEDTATIKLNGGTLQMNEATDLAIETNNENPHGTESTIALQYGATLKSKQLTIAAGTTVTLTGHAGTTLDLGSDAGVDSTKLLGLDKNTWAGKVTTAATDITDVAALGNAASEVELTGAVDSGVIDLGDVGKVHATDSLTAESISGTGALEVDGLATLKKDASNLGNAAFDGGLVLGGDEAAALTGSDLTAASVELTKGSIEAKTLTVGGALTVNDGSMNVDSLTVEGATTVGGAAKSSIIVNGDAYMTGGVELGKGSSLDVEGALVLDGSAIKYNDLDSKVTAGTYDDEKLALAVDTEQLKDAVDAGKDVTLFTLTEGTSEAAISLNGGSNVLSVFGEKYSYSLDWDDAGQNVTLDSVANQNYMKEKFNGASANAKAGATIMDEAFASGATNADGDLKKILAAVDNDAMTEEGLASVAGSSTAVLGMAFAGDVDRQLRAIRNRTTTMGVNQCVVNEGMPYFNAWVNAEGNMGELDKDGTFAGYQLDSWGGTIGFDVDVNPNLTLGLAVTAMYGDLTVDGPDKLDGDLDTMYVSAFARYSARAWTHTFVGTVGMMDSSYKRTVSYGRGESYKTEGDTDGMAFGLMYEVGRVIALTESGSACLQPVFNVAYRHTTAGGYTEKGGDAALKVDDQTLDTVTLGAGARLQAVVGENLYNRTSLLELRALAKVDLGDRASEADVAFIGGAGKATVESAELGAFGVELGAGLSVPMGDEDSGTLFFDVSAELRSGYTNLNGTVGYRINF